MDWTTLKEVPHDIERIISVEREDGKISALVINLPNCAPMRVTGHEYSKSLNIHGPTPPKTVKIYAVDHGSFTMNFCSRANASALAGELGKSVETLEVLETDLTDYAMADGLQSTPEEVLIEHCPF